MFVQDARVVVAVDRDRAAGGDRLLLGVVSGFLPGAPPHTILPGVVGNVPRLLRVARRDHVDHVVGVYRRVDPGDVAAAEDGSCRYACLLFPRSANYPLVNPQRRCETDDRPDIPRRVR